MSLLAARRCGDVRNNDGIAPKNTPWSPSIGEYNLFVLLLFAYDYFILPSFAQRFNEEIVAKFRIFRIIFGPFCFPLLLLSLLSFVHFCFCFCWRLRGPPRQTQTCSFRGVKILYEFFFFIFPVVFGDAQRATNERLRTTANSRLSTSGKPDKPFCVYNRVPWLLAAVAFGLLMCLLDIFCCPSVDTAG